MIKDAERLGVNKQHFLKACCCPSSANTSHSEAFLRHKLDICYMTLQSIKGSSYQRKYQKAASEC